MHGEIIGPLGLMQGDGHEVVGRLPSPPPGPIADIPGALALVKHEGDRLQGAMYLPANYQPGKKYPMLVTI